MASYRMSAAFDRDETEEEIEEESYFARLRHLIHLEEINPPEVFEEEEDLGTFLFDLYMQGDQEDQEDEEIDEQDDGPMLESISRDRVLHANEEVGPFHAERGGERDYKGRQRLKHAHIQRRKKSIRQEVKRAEIRDAKKFTRRPYAIAKAQLAA